MFCRTDLAVEAREMIKDDISQDIEQNEYMTDGIKINRITIKSEKGAERIGKPVGTYVTIEFPSLSETEEQGEELIMAVSREIGSFLPNNQPVLVAGLGNITLTPDALGGRVAEKVFVTRKISEEISDSSGLADLREVAALSVGVLGQTGMESFEIIDSIVKRIRPSCVIIIDALAARRMSRLGTTIQISDTGLFPGSGVGNKRMELSKQTLGVPCIAVGVPTVVDAATVVVELAERAGLDSEDVDFLHNVLGQHGSSMIVTPKEIDLIIERASKLLALSINRALHPLIDF